MTQSATLGIFNRICAAATLFAASALNGSTISHSVDLSWIASTGPSVAGYSVYRGITHGGPYSKLNMGLISGLSFIDTNVQRGAQYFYVITATGSNGQESAFSAEVSVVIPATTGYLQNSVNVVNLSTTIPQNGMLQIAGWAADEVVGAPVSSIHVFLDGSPIGNAILGGLRPDVASAFGRSDFTDSGWFLTYNIGLLAPGPHSVSARAYDSQGAWAELTDYNGAGTFSVVSDTPPFGYLQSALNWYNGSTTLPQYGNLQLSGWAADNEDGAPVNHINVLLDGNVIGQATLGQSRPDVASSYNRSDFRNSGWTFIYNLGNLAVGAHSVTAVAFDSEGLSTQLVGYNGAGPFSVQADTPPFGYIDHVANATDGTTTVTENGVLNISGWAADNEDGAPLRRVAVLIDGNLVGNATLGQLRLDVANAYMRSDFAKSGWSFSFNVGTMSSGDHVVSAVAYDSQGASATLTNYQGVGDFTVH